MEGIVGQAVYVICGINQYIVCTISTRPHSLVIHFIFAIKMLNINCWVLKIEEMPDRAHPKIPSAGVSKISKQIRLVKINNASSRQKMFEIQEIVSSYC